MGNVVKLSDPNQVISSGAQINGLIGNFQESIQSDMDNLNEVSTYIEEAQYKIQEVESELITAFDRMIQEARSVQSQEKVDQSRLEELKRQAENIRALQEECGQYRQKIAYCSNMLEALYQDIRALSSECETIQSQGTAMTSKVESLVQAIMAAR